MTYQRKAHPEDAEIDRQIGRATSFSAFIRRGPHDKTVEFAADYRSARAIADGLNETSRFGRRAIVYAITPEGWSFDVTPETAARLGMG